MRPGLALAALMLPLSGCYLPPPAAPAYAQPGYPPPGYGPPGYPPPGYPPPGYDPYAYPGYNYNNGSPTLFVDGAAMPLIFFGGGWGYYDAHRDFHRAPDAVAHHLDQERAAGGYRPGTPGGRPPGGPPPGGGQGYYHASEQGRPLGAPPPGGGSGFPHPGEPGRPVAGPAGGPPPPGAPRPAAAPQHQDHERGRECPPGQRC